ncbi:hypothetical protein B0T26DRAFT_735069 [Lasiosphaeria miniovina]|uniref:Uncharacterized protein n=1 Tax=Lasiosphaeria miniovina TaxID=1954250 RepID=A0AA39ZQV5_9PEZI|nr:uncharacterized protein B0T26DRAFT_735069 [Lasiosphaeria miniovina]KAK0701874.1 hypothetical protein B0T26DRAFT_735069 [Lasiosphaeria miniovina]
MPEPSTFLSKNIGKQGIDDIWTALSELKDLGDQVLRFLSKIESTGSSQEALDEMEGILDNAQDTLNELEDRLSSIVESLDKWKDMVDEAEDAVNDIGDMLSSILESVDELKDIVDDRRDDLDETEDTDI